MPGLHIWGNILNICLCDLPRRVEGTKEQCRITTGDSRKGTFTPKCLLPFPPTSSRSNTKESQEIVVSDDFISSASDSEDQALFFNAKRHKGRKRKIRKNTLRKRKTPTQESTSQIFSPCCSPAGALAAGDRTGRNLGARCWHL